MKPGQLSIIGFLSGVALLAVAGVLLAFSDPKTLQAVEEPLKLVEAPARFLQVAAQTTGLSGTPSDADSSGSGIKSFDNSLFGGNHVTLAPFGVAGGEFAAYIVGAFFSIIYAFLYKGWVVDEIEPLRKQPTTGKDDFDVNICDCWMDACMCVQLILPCMQYVRAAHTNAVTNTCGFWETFLAYLVTGLCCGLGPCCLTVFFRMKLKEHMGIEDHILNDLCCAWFCMPCAIGQQALAVDQKLGYEVELCCKLKFDNGRDELRNQLRGGTAYDEY